MIDDVVTLFIVIELHDDLRSDQGQDGHCHVGLEKLK